MGATSYRLRLGEFECIAISDGSLNYPLKGFFANAPEAQVSETLAARGLPTTHVTTPYTCLYVNTGRNRIMVDLGAGGLARAASHMFPTIDNSASVTGTLPANLASAGVEPADIDTVVITHAHPDHIGGTLGSDGRPVFANAHYFMTKREWEFWHADAAASGPAAPMVEIARSNLGAIRDRLTLIDDETEILPGICSMPAPGHTPGHIALALESRGERLLHVADTALYPLHLEHPDWIPAFDVDPAVALESKRHVFDRAAEEASYVFAHHFPPFPNLGRVIRQGSGWLWQPLS